MTEQFWRIETDDCRDVMARMEAGSVQTVVTSPPYFGLRDYGHEEQIGLEETPEQYVANLVDVFRAVRRVLRDDGTVWLNLGDSYAGGGGGNYGSGKSVASQGGQQITNVRNRPAWLATVGLKPKDLVGTPWRVAFALQADGWYLRSEIIWHKPNGMPSSVSDRPTYSHEQVFLLTKAPRYFYDAFAVREEDVGGHSSGNGFSGRQGGSARVGGLSGGEGTKEEWKPGGGRNRRSVWSIATEPYPGKHFAVFPKKLVMPCVRSGTPEKGSCAECGAPRQRILVETGRKIKQQNGAGTVRAHIEASGPHGDTSSISTGFSPEKETAGWRPTCVCGAPDGIKVDDLDLIASPIGDSSKDDPSLEVGRAGYSRPRNEGEGTRTITRYQQRRYAEQLKAKTGSWVESTKMRYGLTAEAWAHYVRTDAVGGRPLPPEVLEGLLRDGLLKPVESPNWEVPSTKPAVVFDPFAGAGTTGLVALREGRSFIGAELSPKYAEQARNRLRDDAPLFNVGAEAT